MGHRRALVGRWSRRDRLAVAAVAATVAFLTGTVVLGTAAAAGSTALAGEYRPAATVSWSDSPSAAGAAGPDGRVVVPVAGVTTPDGSPAVVAGVPDDGVGNATEVALPEPPPSGATLGTAAEPRRVRLVGSAGSATATVRPRGPSALPPSWYATDRATARRLGPTGALVVRPAGATVPARGTPVPGGLAFLVAGGRQVAGGLGTLAAAAAVLVAVTVHGTTRATVVDRRATVGVLRATGATPRSVVGLFAARAAALTGTGVALGYAVGVVGVHAAESVAAAAGIATGLPVAVSPRAAGLLLATDAGVVTLGAAAGGIAAWPAARRPPARLLSEPADAGRQRPAPLATSLLDRRAAVPAAAGVAAFAAVALLVASGAAVAGPAVSGGGAVIAEPTAPHPVASTVPAGYAAALRDRGVRASAEVVVLTAADGRPVVVRGARFDAFADVSGARLRSGRRPRSPSEAVVGRDLARTFGVDAGDVLVLGGTTRGTVARVEVVGTYDAPGAADDQLVVPLATARHLAGRPPGTAQFVRLGAAPPAGAAAGRAPVVVGVSAPRRVVADGTVRASVTLVNPAATARNRTVVATLGGASATRTVRLDAGARRTVTVAVPADRSGRYDLTVGGATAPVRVVPPEALRVVGLPAHAPPGSAPRVVVEDARGRPVEAARVSVGDRTRRTGPDGAVRVPLVRPGNATVVARSGNRSATATVRVAAGARRSPAASVRVEPARPTPLTRPVAVVRLSNPWNRTLARTVTVVGPTGRSTRTVRLAPGAATRVRVRLARRPAGSYRVAVRSGGRTVAEASYSVAGGDRLVAAASTRARRGGVARVGLGTAVAAAVGDLRLLAGSVLALVALAALGATTATFAASVRARRSALGVQLATGATRRWLLGTVLADALRVGVPAAVAGVAAGLVGVRALSAAGVLVVYGVSLSPDPSLPTLAGLVAAGAGLSVLGAGLAAAALLRRPPARLLDARPSPGGDGSG